MVYHDPTVKRYRQTDNKKIQNLIKFREGWKDLNIDQLILPHDAESLYEEASRNSEFGVSSWAIDPKRSNFSRRCLFD